MPVPPGHSEWVYCKYRLSCPFKEIRKSPRHRGVYHVLCRNEEGCSQKSIWEVAILLPVREHSAITAWKMRALRAMMLRGFRHG